MNIHFEAQPLINSNKSGIGFCEAGIINAMTKLYPEHEYSLLAFVFRHGAEKLKRLEPFTSTNCRVKACAWVPGSLYRLLWNFIPVPFSMFYGRDADITQFFNYHVPPFVGGKSVTFVHDMCYKACPETVRFKTKTMMDLSLKRSVQRASRILTISEFSKAEIIKYLNVPPEKISVVPMGVDRSIFYKMPENERPVIERCKSKYNISGEYFLYFGTIEPRKNLARLIEAYALLKKTEPNVPKLVLAGGKGWLYDGIYEAVKTHGVEKDVIFTGYVDDGDAPALINGALAFVFPSLYEGFGMPPLEAMACGVPVITANAASLPEVVGDAALLVDPLSVDGIADAMRRMLQSPQLRAELSEKGQTQAALFTWERAAHIVMDVYKELLR